nr:MAG TPA: hypothetical protein [Caudoviricetes sp.]
MNMKWCNYFNCWIDDLFDIYDKETILNECCENIFLDTHGRYLDCSDCEYCEDMD